MLVNNAGVMYGSLLAETTAQMIDNHLSANVRAAIRVAREALKFLPGGGRIIDLASELAYLGRENASVYVATKAAMLGLTRSWARELAPRILVNAVAPGPTDTGLLGYDRLTEAEKPLKQPIRWGGSAGLTKLPPQLCSWRGMARRITPGSA